MKRTVMRTLAACLALLLTAAGLAGCGKEAVYGTADDDILTFIKNSENRPIVHIATQYYTPDTNLVDALQAKFPDYLFVLDYSMAAGVNSSNRTSEIINKQQGFDLLITGSLEKLTEETPPILVDISAESFLDDYLLSALNSASAGGHIYAIPGTSTLSGIAFNANMFDEHGWEIPETHDEFFALCDQIKAAGIKPFSTNFKYTGQVNRLLGMMCYTELFGTPEGLLWTDALLRHEARYKGRMEPMFALAKRMSDAGILSVEDFTASLTKQRQAFWAGEFAMIEYDSAIYTYAEAENVTFDLGIMPYPSKDLGDAGFAITPEFYVAIPKTVEEDPERLALMLDVLAYLSTEEGQEAMLKDSLRVSNVRGVNLSSNPAAKYAEEAVAKGNLYASVSYADSPNLPILTLQQSAALLICEGGTVDEAIELIDKGIDEAFAVPIEEPTYEVIATAEEDFTMLETSYYIADKLREAAGADIGLMMDRGFFRSNLAVIFAGEIDANMERFVMKGVGAEDYLTTYRMTGAQIKELLEHPIINDAEIDALIAASGLSIEYAPWRERGSRVLKLTLADGTALSDDALYTVAAWAGVVAEPYITETVQSFDTLGSLSDILEKALRQDGVIKPDIAKRVKLVWD